MSSKTSTPLGTTGDIAKSNCPISVQYETKMSSTTESKQNDMTEKKSITTCAIVKNDLNDFTTAANASKNEKIKETTFVSSEELKDDDKKVGCSEIKPNDDKADGIHNPLISNKDNLLAAYVNKRIAKKFRVLTSNKMHENAGGKVNKIYFGSVESLLPGNEIVFRILYDDGDVDIMSLANVIDAMRYYDVNKKYDTNIIHKKPISPLVSQSEEENEITTSSANYKQIRNDKTKPTAYKKGKGTKTKAARREPQPVWIGAPDEHLDGGWPKGWLKKVFARKNGASKGSTDRYWYTPKEKFKLRSMVQVRKFLKAVSDTKGDEKKAKAIMVNY